MLDKSALDVFLVPIETLFLDISCDFRVFNENLLQKETFAQSKSLDF